MREEILALTSRTVSIAPMEDQDVLDELAEATRQFDDELALRARRSPASSPSSRATAPS